MNRIGLVADPRCLDHRPPSGHPERPARLQALLDLADSLPPAGPVRLSLRPASSEEIMAVHTAPHYLHLAKSAGHDGQMFDPDTYASAGSFQAALAAAGGLLTVIEAILRGEIENGFALVRPPGHHAESDRAMGFCLFNNIAVAAVDWDVHHGNGTQHMFYRDSRVLYISLHRFPFYPGTGAAWETGAGAGEGYTVNIPLPAGCGDFEFVQAGREIIKPVAERFAPDFVLVSAGFDAHQRDPLGGMEVTETGYAQLAKLVLDIAAGSAAGRLAMVLEGGYDIPALVGCVKTVLEVMAGAEPGTEPAVPAHPLFEPESILSVHRTFWKL
jgi:acetoin utilization deacetylase AcuC-like enzyme